MSTDGILTATELDGLLRVHLRSFYKLTKHASIPERNSGEDGDLASVKTCKSFHR